MFKQFYRYLSVGVLNTLLHWAVFTAVLTLTSAGQAVANLTAFGVAVSFSFVVNARYTFKAQATKGRYMAFVGVMGTLSLLTGWAADWLRLPPLVTLVVFSTISLMCGFIYSKYLVFRENDS